MELKQYLLGACIGVLIFILALTLSYIGILILLKVIFELSALVLIYFGLEYASITISSLFEKRVYNPPAENLNYLKVGKNKRILTLGDIFCVRLLIALLFIGSYLFLRELFVNLGVFFHEIGHLIVALSFNQRILEVSISLTNGFVKYIGFPSLEQRNLILISGTFWMVLIGMIFLIALQQDKKMPLVLNASLSVIIWIELFNDACYWFLGSIYGIGDSYDLINNNPGLDPFIVTFSSLIFLIFLIVFIFLSLGYKIIYQLRLDLDVLIPDLTIFIAQEEKSFFTN